MRAFIHLKVVLKTMFDINIPYVNNYFIWKDGDQWKGMGSGWDGWEQMYGSNAQDSKMGVC